MSTETAIKNVGLSNTDVLVRMYDVGFGDCFLIAYKSGDKIKKILVDCGSIAKRKTAMGTTVKKLVEHVKDKNGKPRIDVVIATHRHKDHVSGFAKPEWNQVEVGEVWLPWTENPNDPEATRIRTAQASFAFALQNFLGFTDDSEDPDISDLTTAEILALNALSNERAMNTLHHGFKNNPTRRFLPDDQNTSGRITDGNLIPEMVAHLLGPSKEEDVIRDMDPPSDQSYLALDSNIQNGVSPSPFTVEWALPEGQGVDRFPSFSEEDRDELQKLNQGISEDFAVALDKAVNGTSLMIMIELKDKFLLLPGDAQWGTWNSVLKNNTARRLLSKTSFYKVGHHCSHNATPVEFIDKVLDQNNSDRVAMVSVRPRSQWKEIPRKPLITELKAKFSGFCRSDIESTQAGFDRVGNIYIDKIL